MIKPKHDIILYRGFSLTLDVYGDYTKLEDPIKLTKYLKSRIGIDNINEINIGNKIKINRSKESACYFKYCTL